MERWERYTHGKGGGRTADHSRWEKIKNIMLILLAVITVGVGFVGGQAISFRNNTQKMIVANALTECGEAVSFANSLSRSGGSDTAGVLGKIRASVNAADVLNDMHQSLYGWELAPRNVYMQLYSVIDSYSAKLRNGTATIEELTNLTDGLTSLQQLLDAAK